MKTKHHRLLICLLLASFQTVKASPDGLVPEPVESRPSVEVAFILDTTGSMSGLIAGAKEKIWSIANEIASAREKPLVKFGLIGYRDRGDDYVTKIYDLSDDLDSIYGQLMGFQAGGGGDGPESVNQALWEGVNQLSWSEGSDTLKLIFLVGDAPPHMDYSDDIHYPEACVLASSKGIIINTVQCGNMGGTQAIWEEIAQLSQGEYVAIEQSGGMDAIRTPVDEDISKLNRAMAATVIVYGDTAAQRIGSSKVSNASSASAETAAERYNYLASAGLDSASAPMAISGEEDLVAQLGNRDRKIDEIERDFLPVELQELSSEDLRTHVATKTKERKEIQEELNTLLAQRRDFIEAEKTRLEGNEKPDGFDEKVKALIRKQGADRGITFE